MTISFTVPGIPVPQSRPRVSRYGTYYPPKVKAYREYVSTVAKAAMRGREPLQGAVACYMIFYMQIPKSLSKKRRQELIGDFVIKQVGDIDNLAKIVMDGANGIVYDDDAQVAVIHASKVYDDKPRVEVEFEEC